MGAHDERLGTTLLPISTSASYTSSFDPTSPKDYTGRGRTPSPPRVRRPPSPRPLHPRQLPLKPPSLPSWRRYLSPRVVSSFLLWSCALYLVHRFLLPLPLPAVPTRSKPSAKQHFLSTTFPQPPLRQGDDSLDSPNPLYRAYSPLPAPEKPFPHLRPTRFLPPRCMEQWFIDGETLCGAGDLGEEEKLDATWLWVNGSDERWKESMLHWREVEGVYSPEHHFRYVPT